MWSPVNVYALPAEQDIIYANEVIKQLENRWDELMKEIALAEEKADRIRQEIFERKAWLAPVRKLPDEILSQIFISYAQMHWIAPVMLGAVCRVWRRVVLATPRAWAHVNLDSINPKMLSFWIERCGVAEVHALSGLSAGASIAQCHPGVTLTSLTLDRSAGVCGALAHHYPKLRTLQIRFCGIDNSPPPSTSIIDVARFPNLIRLHLDSVSNSWPSHFAIADGFPPLQELVITNAKGQEWVRIVRLCAPSLRVLEIGFLNVPIPEKVITIDLPVLKHLAYRYDMSGAPSMTLSGPLFPLNLTTPSLESYHESQNSFSSPLHNDVRAVSELWLQKCLSGPNFHSFNIASFRNVRKIHTDFDTKHGFKVILRTLDRDPDVCVHLESIHNYGTTSGVDAGIGVGTDVGPKNTVIQNLRPRRSQKGNPVVVYHNHSFPLNRLEFSHIVKKYPPQDATSRIYTGRGPDFGLNMHQWTPLPIPIPSALVLPPTPVSPIGTSNGANGLNGGNNPIGAGAMFGFPFF